MLSVLNKWLFREMLNSRRCDEFSEHLHIVLFTLGDPELNAVYNTTADVLHVPPVLEVMARGWESLNAKAELARMHRDGHCHEAVRWYVHLRILVACRSTLEESYRRATTQEPIIEGGSLVSPGLASQRDRFLTAKQGRLVYQRHCSRRPDAVGWAPLVGQARSLPPSGDCGSVATCPVQWRTEHEGGDPKTDQVTQGADSELPGWQPKENEAQLPFVTKRYSLTGVGKDPSA